MKPVKIRKRIIPVRALRTCAGLGLRLPLLLAGPAALAELDLGPAADFAVFQMGTTTGGARGGGSWTSSNVTINGDVGFRDTTPGGNDNTIAYGDVEGTAASAPDWSIGGWYPQASGSTLRAIAQQARTFSAAAVAAGAGLPNIGTVSTTATYTFTTANLAEPGTYIVDAKSVSETGGNIFTLDGSQLPTGSKVIMNVSSSFSLSGGSQIAVSGLTPDQVLINYTGTRAAGASGGIAGTAIYGTFLDPNSSANFNAASTVIFGSLIAQNVNLSSGLTVQGISFVPEPSTFIAGALLFLPLGASALRIVGKRKAEITIRYEITKGKT